MNDRDAQVTAVLGPTNTGKTHYAIERMLGHRDGVIGLPLRLLAREVYDRIVALRGPSVVALLTGEERIVPPRAQYWVCTVEAMPIDLGCSFLAVDEIQLCADPDRGYVFTDRLLNARGLTETLLLGSETMRGRIANLVPGARFLNRERFSSLSYAGSKKLGRIPPRSAVVGFSVEQVYAMAELLRRQKGGAAVVMGALSPRTRNAQVELYQNGDVDYLVATDAIGMGLNLDINHVAFAGTSKFDGRRHRQLAPNELAQIAGRAGRFTTDGSFGVTGEAAPFHEETIQAIESHRFTPLRKLQWRNSLLEFGSTERLVASLEAPSGHDDLVRAREADDLRTLKVLAALPAIRDMLSSAPDVRLLWEVCQIPDFRKVSHVEHDSLCQQIFEFIAQGEPIPDDWLANRIRRIDKPHGNIDALSKRLAYIRTWTYVAQRKDWVRDTSHWREETRAVEDRLSDALHAALTQRFIDRRTSVLMRRLKQKEGLVAEVNDKGEVHVADQFVGKLEGFRFQLDPNASAEEAKTLRAAALQALQPAYNLRSDKFYNAPDSEIDLTEQGGLMWGEYAIGKLTRGADALSPQIAVFVDDEAGAAVAAKVERRLSHWLDRRIAAQFEPLVALRDDTALEGLARGIGFRLVESMGVVPRSEIAQDLKSLDQDQRALLRKHGVRFGQYTVFMPLLLKPAVTRLRLVLWALQAELDDFPEAPPPGLVTVPALPDAPEGYYPMAGYRLAGARAIRIDMLERLADMIRGYDARAGFEGTADMLSITGLTLEQFADLMTGLGYQAERGERPKPAPQAAAPGADSAIAAPSTERAQQPEDDTPEQPANDAGTEAAAAEAGADVPATETPSEPRDAPAAPHSTAENKASEAATNTDDQADTAAGTTEPAPAATEPGETEPGPADPAADIEVYYTFRWAPRRRPDTATKPRKADGKGRKKGPKSPRREQAKPAPPRRDKPVDPDSPFAALMALKEKR